MQVSLPAYSGPPAAAEACAGLPYSRPAAPVNITAAETTPARKIKLPGHIIFLLRMNVMDHHTLTKWQPEPGCRTLFLSEQPTTLLFPFDSSAFSFKTHQGFALEDPKWS